MTQSNAHWNMCVIFLLILSIVIGVFCSSVLQYIAELKTNKAAKFHLWNIVVSVIMGGLLYGTAVQKGSLDISKLQTGDALLNECFSYFVNGMLWKTIFRDLSSIVADNSAPQSEGSNGDP